MIKGYKEFNEGIFSKSNDLLYDELSIDEFRIFLDSHNMIDFDEVELDYLSSIFGKYSLASLRIAKRTDAKFFLSTTIIRELKIYKFDDEWYLIKICKGSWKDFGYEATRYKCDTFDGVKQFIEQNLDKS